MFSSAEMAGMFDRVASRYDALNRVLSFGFDILWRRRTIAALGPLGGARVLDLATGTGDVALMIAARFPGAAVTGVDISDAMLRLARAKGARRGARVQFLQGDALALPFSDGAFDAATFVGGIRNVSNVGDPLAALCELRRVLRPGGRAAILEGSLPHLPFMRLLFFLYLYGALPVFGLFSSDPKAYRYLRASLLRFARECDVRQLMEQAGFSRVQVRPLTGGVVTLYSGEA